MLARNSIVKFDPRRVPGCDMWFRRGTGIVYTASYVTGWNSIVGGINATGSGGITFNAADLQYGYKPTLVGSDSAGFGFITRAAPQQPFTVAFVGHVGNTRANNVAFVARYSGTPTTWWCLVSSELGARIGSFNLDASAWTYSDPSPKMLTAPSVVIAVFNGANSTVRNLTHASANGALSALQPNQSNVGISVSAWGTCMRTTVHVATWPRALSDAEQRYLMAGFAAESNLTIT
jgi:hypothetical protein